MGLMLFRLAPIVLGLVAFLATILVGVRIVGAATRVPASL
jgi:hypothetical protein